jgi:hypothetical protein
MHVASINNNIISVPVLVGAANELCSHRELRTTYCTNRSIKTWAHFFLLKSQTTSGVIQNWIKQKQELLSFCKINEQTFRARCKELIALKLITIHPQSHNITLASFTTAAEIMGIEYNGIINIDYDTTAEGTQIFQYILRCEEIRENKQCQISALHYYAKTNSLLWQHLTLLLTEKGAHAKQLENDAHYFQLQLLALQQVAFRHGSELYKIIMQLRADVNRSVEGIKRAHNYKAAQSVSYMKGRMEAFKIIEVEKKVVYSPKRSHLYIPTSTGQRELTKWLAKRKETAWFLCDNLKPTYKTQKRNEKNEKQKAAA